MYKTVLDVYEVYFTIQCFTQGSNIRYRERCAHLWQYRQTQRVYQGSSDKYCKFYSRRLGNELFYCIYTIVVSEITKHKEVIIFTLMSDLSRLCECHIRQNSRRRSTSLPFRWSRSASSFSRLLLATSP